MLFSHAAGLCQSGALHGRELRYSAGKFNVHRLAAMPVDIDDDELAAGPRFVKLPRRLQRRTDIPAAMDQHARYMRDTIHVSKNSVAAHKSRVLPVVDDQGREEQTEFRIAVARTRRVFWVE